MKWLNALELYLQLDVFAMTSVSLAVGYGWLFQHLTNNTTRNKALCLHRFMSTDVQKYSYTIIRSRGSSNDYHQSRETEADKGFTKFFMFIANQFYALQILLLNPQVECVQPQTKK